MKKTLIALSSILAIVALATSLSLMPAAAAGKKCPISGKDVDPKVTLNVNGQEVAFCCDKCPAAYLKKYLVKDGEVAACPVSGKPANAEHSLIHLEAKKVAFCCENCPKKFAKEHGFEIKAKEPKECPISGKPAKAEFKLVVNGEPVYFCCENCPKKYAKNLNVKGDAPYECVVAGRPAKKETEMIFVTGKKVYFCCDKCPKGYAKKNFPAE